MKTKIYIQEFNLNNPTDEDLQAFLKAFSREFEDRLVLTTQSRKMQSLDTPFNIFQLLVKESQVKWDSINAHCGGKLPSKLWNQFYAACIIKLREKNYPKEHEEITARRLKKLAREQAKADFEAFMEATKELLDKE